MRRRALQAGLALAIAAMPAHAQTPDCGGWNTREFFILKNEIATGADVERCLAQGYSTDARDEEYGATPLHQAAWHSDGVAAIEALLGAGAEVDARAENGWTPLHVAARRANAAAIEALLDAGAEVDARDEDGETPLHRAAYFGNAAAIGALINAGAEVDARDGDASTPLHLAVLRAHAAAIEALLDAGADPKAWDAGGRDAFDILDVIPALNNTDAYRRLNDLRFD